jgi:uncharacterized protein YlzI (FlbEa/FlbD family)
MYIKLTRMNGQPIWLNASFVVTVEPTRIGGAIVVPIGDGLDYEVRESPETVLALLAGAPAPTVVPVRPPQALVPQPEDVSPEDERPSDPEPEPEKPAEEAKPAKRGRRRKKSTESSATASTTVKVPDTSAAEVSRMTETPEPEGFREIVADLKARKCRTGKRLRNAIKSYFKKTDEIEIDYIIETMINRGYMLVGADGHVTWIENPS